MNDDGHHEAVLSAGRWTRRNDRATRMQIEREDHLPPPTKSDKGQHRLEATDVPNPPQMSGKIPAKTNPYNAIVIEEF